MDKLTIKWYKDSLWLLIVKTAALLGAYGTFIEFLKQVFPKESLTQCYSFWIIIPAVLISLCMHKPKRKYSFKIRDKDIIIELRIGNMFDNKSENQVGLVIPTNTTFTTTPYNNIITPSSIQGQFARLYFDNNLSSLDQLLESSLSDTDFIEVSANKVTKKKKYSIGTTAKISLNGIISYWLALADMNDHGAVNGNIEDIYPALNGLWDYIAKCGNKDTLVLPIIGSGKTAIPENIEKLFIIIVESFLSYSSSIKISRKLIICILVGDVVEDRVNMDRILKFLEYQTLFMPTKKSQNRTSIEIDK